MVSFTAVLTWLLVLTVVAQQDYSDYPEYQDYADEYGQDNLYTNYANHQQEKVAGGWVLSVATHDTKIDFF